MIPNSSDVSFPGFSRMLSGMAILPTSCMGADSMSSCWSGFDMPRLAAMRREKCAILWMWEPVSGSRNSAARERR